MICILRGLIYAFGNCSYVAIYIFSGVLEGDSSLRTPNLEIYHMVPAILGTLLPAMIIFVYVVAAFRESKDNPSDVDVKVSLLTKSDFGLNYPLKFRGAIGFVSYFRDFTSVRESVDIGDDFEKERHC